MLAKIQWPTAVVIAVTIASAATLSALHVALPQWLTAMVAVIAGSLMPQVFANKETS
jgi:hypothetical protein